MRTSEIEVLFIFTSCFLEYTKSGYFDYTNMG